MNTPAFRLCAKYEQQLLYDDVVKSMLEFVATDLDLILTHSHYDLKTTLRKAHRRAKLSRLKIFKTYITNTACDKADFEMLKM